MAKIDELQEQLEKLQKIQEQLNTFRLEKDVLNRAKSYADKVQIGNAKPGVDTLIPGQPIIDFNIAPFGGDKTIMHQIIDRRIEYIDEQIELLDKELQ